MMMRHVGVLVVVLGCGVIACDKPAAETPVASPEVPETAEKTKEVAEVKKEDKPAAADPKKDPPPSIDPNSPMASLKGDILFTRYVGSHAVLFSTGAASPIVTKVYEHKDATNSNVLAPRWSKEGITMAVYDGDGWATASIQSDGSGIKLDKSKEPDTVVVGSRVDDLMVEDGQLFAMIDAKKTLLHAHEAFDPNDNPGVQEASWGPEKKHVIFEHCNDGQCAVVVKDLKGTQVRRISGAGSPDWK